MVLVDTDSIRLTYWQFGDFIAVKICLGVFVAVEWGV